MVKEEKLKVWVARDKFDDGLSIYSVVKPKEKGVFGVMMVTKVPVVCLSIKNFFQN